uniref:Uncharacterized protein n=1 Tax=Lactuca sativa TaxID=4236 RepID=A0A9R1VMK5_LACSA|nr:hypothetical protein LSAT_V11C400158950 [Lactuca sativa]
MAGFHLPGEPYFPNQGNAEWIVQDPEEILEDELEEEVEEEVEEEEEEEEEDESDTEFEVIDPPYMTRGQRPPFWMQRGFYDLRHGGPVDRALPVMVRRISNIGDQSQTIAHRVMEIRDAMEVTVACTCDLKREFNHMDRLVKDLTTARAEVMEYQERHAALVERVWNVAPKIQSTQEQRDITTTTAASTTNGFGRIPGGSSAAVTTDLAHINNNGANGCGSGNGMVSSNPGVNQGPQRVCPYKDFTNRKPMPFTEAGVS